MTKDRAMRGNEATENTIKERRQEAGAGLSQFAADALRCLYQHRLLTTRQLHRLLIPAADQSYARAQLGRLRGAGFAAATRRTTLPHDNVWYLTEAGAEIIEATGELTTRAYRMDPLRANGTLQQHTLAVNDTGLAFVETARRLGHDCGPLDWTPEVAHRVGSSSSSRDRLIVDAVLHYVAETDHHRSHHTVFLEIDRCTMTIARLAEKLTRYAAYYVYRPAPAGRRPSWQLTYPRFPQVLFVFTGAPLPRLLRRIADLHAYARSMPQLRRLRIEPVTFGASTLLHLQERGPFEPIMTPLLDQHLAHVPIFAQVTQNSALGR